ncbi:MAG TPA: tetratricopeptide repeat protein, partial [Thermoguttaceae bacterium]|nr:tetratricopeptide repeat protein [Thermoguttaceae bacterium]
MTICRSSLTLVVLVVVILFAGKLRAESVSSVDTPLVSDEIRELMQDRDYPAAIEAIDRAAKQEDAPRDYLIYLKGRALFLQQQYDAAVAVFKQLPERFPQSDWTRRAHFAEAVALARKGDFRAAELIYRTEAEYLLSPDRKQQIADLYLEFADTYFDPPKEDRKPDYAKALEFYKKALEVGPKPRRRAEVELLIAQCQQNLGQHGQAANSFTQFIERYDDSELDIASLEIEARFRLGQCRMAEGNRVLARRSWQDLLAEHADADSERIAEATFELSRTWNIPTPGNDEELALGTAALRTFLQRFAEHKLAGRAHLDIARSNIHRGRYEDAVTSLKQFLDDARYADLDEIPDARNLLGRSYQLQKKFTEALATWQEYLAKHPAHEAWSAVQRQIIDTEYLMAAEKLEAAKSDTAKADTAQYDAANELFAQFLAKYPLDGRNPRIVLLMNEKNIHAKQWDEAIAAWRRLVSKYPKTNEASAAQFSIGQTLEQELEKLDEALEEYRKVTWGNSTGAARQAIARLTAKTMTVATEGVFRSDETPRLKLTTRNIESVSVRAYKVDMETYFRKMHLARGVEQLDVSLIDPDRTFEFEVPDYAEFQETESSIEVPLPEDLKSGVMAVTVSSPTLEATTLVIQSDLDLIVKSSRDEVFVFAQNMLTGKPWADARLLISDGKNVFAEATTGDDGVLQQAYEELKDAGDVRVFAIAGENVASNVVGLQGVGVACGLSDKGYLYTDRPAYRAGELVHLRGCLRSVTDDAYTVEKDKSYTVEVFDGRNRLVRQEELTLNEFGSFHTHFVLPVSAPQGQYRVLARDKDNNSYQGTFQVHQQQLEPIRLTIDTPRNVYYRGEQIEGTIKAEFYYGAPLADREISYQLADGRLHTATTDA